MGDLDASETDAIVTVVDLMIGAVTWPLARAQVDIACSGGAVTIGLDLYPDEAGEVPDTERDANREALDAVARLFGGRAAAGPAERWRASVIMRRRPRGRR